MLSGSPLCDRLPHEGALCLLERVLEWDESGIHCTATSHRDPNNPLRNGDGLAAVTGVEYATQAIALHGSLVLADPAPRAGFLASLRNLELAADWLHDLDGALSIVAAKVGSDAAGAIYDFRIETNNRLLLSGRATVMYEPTPRSV